MRHITSFAAIALVSMTTTVRAQSYGDAFTALRATPIAALTPLMTPAMISRRMNGAQFALRYGLGDDQKTRTHSLAASGIFALGMQSSATLTAGVSDADCARCDPAPIISLGADARVYEGGDMVARGSALTVA